MTIKTIKHYIQLESSSSILLFLATVTAIIFANSPLSELYNSLCNQSFFGEVSLKVIVNEGLMTLFFLLISLELKKALIIGELNTRRKALLPFIASFGGVLMAAIVFLIINFGNKHTQVGWAIPTATDVAFAAAVLTLMGRAIPASLKVFLFALAITDDLIAIGIISVFYTRQPNILFVILSIVCFLLLIVCNRLRLQNKVFYISLGVLLWLCIVLSNVNPPLAGVLIGLIVPLHANKTTATSPLVKLERILHPWVSFAILPIFAFVNSGLTLSGIGLNGLFHTLTLGIIFGLFFGKQLGVFLASWIAVKIKIAKLPTGVNWSHLYGLSVICGVGFTMNLFIGFLAFADNTFYLNLIKLGVITGALLSGSVGYIILRQFTYRRSK